MMGRSVRYLSNVHSPEVEIVPFDSLIPTRIHLFLPLTKRVRTGQFVGLPRLLLWFQMVSYNDLMQQPLVMKSQSAFRVWLDFFLDTRETKARRLRKWSFCYRVLSTRRVSTILHEHNVLECFDLWKLKYCH